MTSEQLISDAADTVTALAAKVREATTLGRPSDASDYAMALSSAASAYRDLCSAAE